MSPTRRSDPPRPPGRPSRAAALVPALAWALAACAGAPSMFDAAGEGARRIARLTWFMIVLAAAVYAVVVALLAAAVVRGRRRGAAGSMGDVDLAPRSTAPVVIGGAAAPAVILVAVFVVSLGAMGRFPVSADRGPHFTVTGHQWWWEVQYEGPDRRDHFSTANEIHVPVGVPVRLTVRSQDVIHSFWVPQLQGKIDLIPGDSAELRLVAERPGRFRGQCAEYCGVQHAHMAFVVVAEPVAQFRAWLAAQRAAAPAPADSEAALGQRLVTTGPCALCHTIRGTDARGQVAPDLTHVGSRLTLAAGALPNTLGTMEAWIANAQSLKPGTKMPTITQFGGRELRAMAAYLETLR